MDKFIDRKDAGIILSKYLQEFAHEKNTIVLALPRGGVPVAYEIATALYLTLDIFIVRKLGLPQHEEFAMGAIASGDTLILNQDLLKQINLDSTSINNIIESEKKELERREHLYRGNRPFPNIEGKKIILVDDGIATGFTMRAAIEALYHHKPASIIVAVPVADYKTCEKIALLVDKMICPLRPVNFYAVGLWYESFSQASDDEVLALLHQANSKRRNKEAGLF